MATLLVRNISWLVTMDSRRREIPGGGLFIRDGFIEKVAATSDLPQQADEILDLDGYLVLPGLINTHHHFYQTLTRAVPHAQNANLFGWLRTLYPIWARLTPEDIYISTRTALLELAFSGCTTASDHLYLFPNGSRLDDEIAAAEEVGLRLHASRGSMSLGESQGGLPPDTVVDSEEKILADSLRVIQRYHDPKPGSMCQVALAPCSPFSVSGDLMRQSALLARQYGVRLHTHLAETEDEENFCLGRYGYRPLAYMETLDWVGSDVWFAHAVYINDKEISVFAHHGCGVAHCPTSNMRLGSGIAPIERFLSAGVSVGLGVDGSASNDSSHLLAEARQAMLVARLKAGLEGASLTSSGHKPLFSARQALELATVGGAAVLGRDDIGSLEAGKCADWIGINLNRLDYAGGLVDPVAAVMLCAPQKVDIVVVQGRFIIKDGECLTIDVSKQTALHQKASKRLLSEI